MLVEYTKEMLVNASWADCAMALIDTAVIHHDKVTTILLNRHGRLQTELVITHPAWELPITDDLPQHRHPGIDSIVVGISRCEGFIRNGKIVLIPDQVYLNVYPLVFIEQDDLHAFRPNALGSVMLVTQLWYGETKMTSVGLVWEGQATDPSHQALIDDAK